MAPGLRKRGSGVVVISSACRIRAGWFYLETGSGRDLAAAGLTPAAAQDATLTLVLPGDRAVWPIGRTPWTVGLTGYGNVARVVALQVLYDLSHASGPDAGDAASAWLAWMLSPGPVV